MLEREEERPNRRSVLLAEGQSFETQLNWGFMWNHLFMVCQTPAYPCSVTLLKHRFCLVLTFKIRFYFFYHASPLTVMPGCLDCRGKIRKCVLAYSNSEIGFRSHSRPFSAMLEDPFVMLTGQNCHWTNQRKCEKHFFSLTHRMMPIESQSRCLGCMQCPATWQIAYRFILCKSKFTLSMCNLSALW